MNKIPPLRHVNLYTKGTQLIKYWWNKSNRYIRLKFEVEKRKKLIMKAASGLFHISGFFKKDNKTHFFMLHKSKTTKCRQRSKRSSCQFSKKLSLKMDKTDNRQSFCEFHFWELNYNDWIWEFLCGSPSKICKLSTKTLKWEINGWTPKYVAREQEEAELMTSLRWDLWCKENDRKDCCCPKFYTLETVG